METPHKKAAVVMDFDGTLAADSASTLVQAAGGNPESFWKAAYARAAEGWDFSLAWLCLLCDFYPHIDRRLLETVGRSIVPFSGVPDCFRIIREHGQSVGVDVQFHILSCGIADLIRYSGIGTAVDEVVASEFEFTGDGTIRRPKRIMSSTIKTRRLFEISKGISVEEAARDPDAVNRRQERREGAIPLSHFIYAGDGLTDVEAFTIIHKYHGLSLGVCRQNDAAAYRQATALAAEGRFESPYTADYTPGSELMSKILDRLSSL